MKKAKKVSGPAKSLQEMGAEAQKAAVASRVDKRLHELRQAMARGEVQGPFSKSFVLRWIKVDKHTIKRSYHEESADKIEAFLLETDRACGVVKREPKKRAKKRSMREQMAALAVEAEAMRLRLQCEIDDLLDELQAKGKRSRPTPKNFRSIVRLNATSIVQTSGSPTSIAQS